MMESVEGASINKKCNILFYFLSYWTQLMLKCKCSARFQGGKSPRPSWNTYQYLLAKHQTQFWKRKSNLPISCFLDEYAHVHFTEDMKCMFWVNIKFFHISHLGEYWRISEFYIVCQKLFVCKHFKGLEVGTLQSFLVYPH